MVSLSGENLTLDYIDRHYFHVKEALIHFYAPHTTSLPSRFVGYTLSEIKAELNEHQREHEILSVLSLLASIEAIFRVDYINRVSKKHKDILSRHFRELARKYDSRVSFEEDILEGWKNFTSIPPPFIGEIRTAFKFRHWIAHGRYWVPKFGRHLDYDYLYRTLQTVLSGLPLVN